MPYKIRTISLSTLAVVCVLAVSLVGQASAAKLENTTTALLAVYGSPGASGTTLPVGGGLARNFGFGENMLFQATATAPGEQIEFTLGGVVFGVQNTYLGATLKSNSTGANNPLGLSFQFVNLGHVTIGGTATAVYTDTSDGAWTTDLCPPASTTCKTDPNFTGPAGEVQINDATFDVGPGTVVQGPIFGVWSNGTTTTPSCIKLNLPPTGAAADQTLTVTSSSIFPVGTKITAIKGKACLISANNDYYPGSTPALTIANE
jgi:hypothetical protein